MASIQGEKTTEIAASEKERNGEGGKGGERSCYGEDTSTHYQTTCPFDRLNEIRSLSWLNENKQRAPYYFEP